jgi:hypothetical protein
VGENLDKDEKLWGYVGEGKALKHDSDLYMFNRKYFIQIIKSII